MLHDSQDISSTVIGKVTPVERWAGFSTSEVAALIKGFLHTLEGSQSVLTIVPNQEIAERLLADLNFFLNPLKQADIGVQSFRVPGFRACGFLGWEVLPFDVLSPTSDASALRIATLYRLMTGQPTLVISTAEALFQRILPRELLLRAARTVQRGETADRDELSVWFDEHGYQRRSLVEEVGQVAVRGAVLDFYPPGISMPVRLEFFGDQLESIRLFDPGNQRSKQELCDVVLLPVREVLPEVVPPLPNGAPHGVTERDSGTVPAKTLAIPLLRARASDLGIPLKAVSSIEESLLQGFQVPGLEHLAPFFSPRLSHLTEYFAETPKLIVVDEPAVHAAADDFENLLQEREKRAQEEGRLFPTRSAAYRTLAEVQDECSRASIFFDSSRIFSGTDIEDAHPELSSLASAIPKRPVYNLQTLHTALQAARHKERPFQPLAEEIGKRLREGYRIALVVAHASRAGRVRELLAGYDIAAEEKDCDFQTWLHISSAHRDNSTARRVAILSGELSGGLRDPAARFLLIPDTEIFPDITSRKLVSSARSVRRFLGSVSQLKEEDFVVHVEHGIGVYRGLKQISVDGKIGDFLHLEYAEGAKLFVPVENIGKIQKYASAEAKKPALTKLGGKAWNATKKKVRENVAELAGQLIRVIAEREIAKGVSLGQPEADDQAFADSFPYEETPDQSRAIQDVLQDLSKKRPMDRLVCGDVGYGKTEVAIRAAFRAVNAGKQVAVLVPTTILAEQHSATFQNRFADSPVRIGCVNRFQSAAENRRTLEDVAAGKIDIVIGTHRLLQRDVLFADLGLVVIDEEHRFGVAHKEKLKRMRSEVHVLTLTATPIPRTLHMSLMGIRDLSTIETPPVNRQVIRTYLATYSENIVREAILRELGRSGQVFYIHNRVENIKAIAEELQELVPEAKVVFGHGQMKERELEDCMHTFLSGKANVLVSTTIVESGLDIPNANTIIIRHAEKFGLADLYQLRGRVGRSSRRAYAYLLIPDPKTVSSEARKRLQVLQSLDDLGVGFRLALQDMEIRGAGNLLGRDQSGHIGLVGFELYSRILKDAVEELRRGIRPGKGSREQIFIDPEIKIGFPAHIPPSYVPDVAERLLLYQRSIELRNEEEAEAMREEIEDRFGHPPKEVLELLDVMVFRALARRAGIVLAQYRNEQLFLAFHPQFGPQQGPGEDSLKKAIKEFQGALRISGERAISLHIPQVGIESPRDLCRHLEALISSLDLA